MDEIQTKLSMVKRLRAQGVPEDQIEGKLAQIDAIEEDRITKANSSRNQDMVTGQLRGVLLTPRQADSSQELRDEYLENNPELQTEEDRVRIANRKLKESIV